MSTLPQTLPKPSVLWASDTDIARYPGLYVSPNMSTLPKLAPENLTKNIGRLPLPWPWLYTRLANQLHYWTAVTPRETQYTGLLQPLAGIKVVQGNNNQWRLENVQEWRDLEDFLRRVLDAMKRTFPLGSYTPLLVQIDRNMFPWPQDYNYDCSCPTKKQAKSFLGLVRGVFRINVSKVTYAGHEAGFGTRGTHVVQVYNLPGRRQG
ncbi:hypothetical protein BC835DRAFT_1311197 [Cytidiella melzeri]|nr:hypothetical protein BC835DRAFT_1311197 [Cytidiella melzeri]